MSNKPKSNLDLILFLIFTGAVVLVAAVVSLYFHYFNGPILLEHEKWGVFGDFIGGTLNPFLSLLGLLAILITINIQRKELAIATNEFKKTSDALESQLSYLDIQNFESHFFELLRIHRENVESLSHKIPTEENYVESGKRVFLHIGRQFNEVYKISCNTFGRHGHNVSKMERIIIEISYAIVVFGTGKSSGDMLLKHIEIRHSEFLLPVKAIIGSCRGMKSVDGKTQKFGGHLSRLGHYFRSLFNIVTYVHHNTKIDDELKYEYVKILRAQFSVDELFVFFLNSLSLPGEAWQRNDDNLIVKYQLIKNLPEEFTFGIDIAKYYPEIDFERI